MIEFIRDIFSYPKWKKYLFFFLLLISIPYKFFYLSYQNTISGPDIFEYSYVASLISKKGIIGLIQSNDPFTLWRLPFLPLVLYICQKQIVFYIIQLIASYFLAYNFYKIFLYVTRKSAISYLLFFVILFLPYINLAACAAITEFIQISLFIYGFRKVLYRQYDWKLAIALCAFCLLRAEGQYFIYFLILRELFLKNYSKIIFYTIPLVVVVLWCVRNKTNFGTFSLVNPILSSRAMIGSIYGFIYVSEKNEFHTKYDYYQGRDYVNRKQFVTEYKEVVRKELINKIFHEPFDYIKIRIKQIAYSFLYIGFNLEHLPDSNWKFQANQSFEQITQNNQCWAYSMILKNKDYGKLLARLVYNGGLAFMNLFGFIFIFINYRKLLPLLFILLNFSFVFIVEVDMRYLITIQSVSVCAFVMLCYSIFKHRTITLNWIDRPVQA